VIKARAKVAARNVRFEHIGLGEVPGEARAAGLSVRTTAAKFEVDPATVQRISRPFEASVVAAVS
jgi:hypothetical protein